MSPLRRGGSCRRRVRFAALLALIVAALAASGCGDTVIDSQKAEDTIQAYVESKNGLDRKVAAVDCPSDVKVVAGTTFECSLTFSDGKTAKTVMYIRDADADVNLEDILPHSIAREAGGGSG